MEHASIPYVREILIFLTAAGVLVPLFARFHISPVLGFLVAGLLLGPHGAGHLADIWPVVGDIVITQNEGIHALAEMGVIFLLFMIGLEISFERLMSMRRFVFGLGFLQMSLTTLAIGAVAHIFGNAPGTSLLLGVGFALSSTAIVMQLLTEQRRLGSTVGRKSFAILLFQDLSVVLLFFILGFTGQDLSGGLSMDLAIKIGKAFGFATLALIGIVVVGRLLVRPLFHLAGKSHNKEVFMAATLLAVIATAAGTEYAGFSTALGAFLAGLLLAETEYRHDVEATVEPFKGLLLGVFFMSVGMDVDPTTIWNSPVAIIGAVLGLFALKAGVLYPIARMFGVSSGRAVELGLLLGQGGEFVFILIALAQDMNILPGNTAQYMLIVASLSMMLTPLMAKVGYRLRIAIEGPDLSVFGPGVSQVDNLDNHVILAGYGRMGQMLSDILYSQQIPVVAIDITGKHDHDQLPILHGRAEDPELLTKAGLDRAIAIAVLINNRDDSRKVVAMIKQLCPRIPIIARARDTAHAVELYKLGAHHTISDVVEGGLHVAQEVLMNIGLPEDAARHIIEQQRMREAHMIATAKAG